jgi:predicted RNA-binding protein (virulence factor B family)
VKKIREENKLDISLQPVGYRNFNNENTDTIYRALKERDGFITITDKSSPEEIYAQFGMSKKAFKKAVGALYKERKIVISEDGLKLI